MHSTENHDESQRAAAGRPVQDQRRGSRPPGGAVFGQIRVVGLALFLPFIMVAGPVAGYWVGRWIGQRLGGIGWAGPVGLLIGAAASVHQTIVVIRRLRNELR